MNVPAVLFFLSVLSLVFSSQAFSACSPEQILRDDVLIVVNDNSRDSAQVGDYYCERRGIDPANIVHVRVPATSDVQYDQFVSLRDQIIRFLRENTLAAGTQPVSCDQAQGYSPYYCPESMKQIRQLTKIRYLVLTKGIPARFNFRGSTLPYNPEAAVDNYLRFWLTNYFDEDVQFTFNARAIVFQDGRGMRTVAPAIDRELIVGRMDGINASSARNLVDRAIRAEKNGIFGKLYGSKFGPGANFGSDDGAYWKQWLPDGGLRVIIYPGWKYLHGLFGQLQAPAKSAVRHDLNPECLTYDTSGKVPQDCVTRLTSGATPPETSNDAQPGSPEGRIPRADTALVYQGYSDGFSSVGSFGNLLNWRETEDCSTLCASDDALCRGASTDVYQEIDTRCVRVADGFIGYNFQSYPVGMMAAWPTGWFQNVNDRFFNTGGAHYYMWPPEIRDDAGFDDNYSLWYRNTDQKSTAACYTDSDDLQGAPSGRCVQEKKINLNQTVRFPRRAIDLTTPQKIIIRFKYRALDLNKPLSLNVSLFVHEPVYKDQSIFILSEDQVDYGRVAAAVLNNPNTPADAASWGDAVARFTLDPDLHHHPQYLYDGVKIRIESIQTFEGQVAIDTVSVEEDGIDIPLKNASFSDGHRQLSGGDSAATFLSRLNGTAFWGNISHHEAEGHSFDSHPYETLIYFMRGLPLGDAVWFAETHNSGILYGDPLYSPAAIHLHYLPSSDPWAPNDHFITTSSSLALRGDTLNGTGPDVTTVYSVDYCSGHDFLICDQGNSWYQMADLQNKPGGARNMPLGSWDYSALPAGDYTLRLSVTSSNAATGYSQTFYDYYTVTLFSPGSDEDADGLSYTEEIELGINPWKADSDADGLPDNEEFSLGTDPGNADSDADRLPDGWEIIHDLDPLDNTDTSIDADADGLTILQEYIAGTDPNNKDTDSDGVVDGEDDLPLDSEGSVDTDGDGIGNKLDPDDDNDGVIDVFESDQDSLDASTASGLPLLNGDTLTIVTASGESLAQVTSTEVEAIDGRSGINLLLGLVSYTTSAEIGGSVTVRMTLSRKLPEDLIIYKLNDEGGIYELPPAFWRQLDERTIEISVTDGDPLTDSDNSVNGSITDPVILGAAPASSSGGGGGCTINPKGRVDPVWLLLLAAYLRMYLVRNGFTRKSLHKSAA